MGHALRHAICIFIRPLVPHAMRTLCILVSPLTRSCSDPFMYAFSARVCLTVECSGVCCVVHLVMPSSAMSSKRNPKRSYARLTPVLRGIIYGLFLAGTTLRDIADHEDVVKEDGSSPSLFSVHEAIETTRGEQQGTNAVTSRSARGKPRKTTAKLDKAIVKAVFKHRGRVKVTSKYIRKTIPEARKVTERTIRRRLEEAGLAWLRRVRKTLVTEAQRTARLEWADWVLKQPAVKLARFAYTDGCSFYLARTPEEDASKKRGGLGPFVWRRTDRSDALYHDCIGPSSYWKGQGALVRIWGMLVAGTLLVYVMPDGETMNRWWYNWLITKRFAAWLKELPAGKKYVLQDHERCLWSTEALEGFKEIGAEPVHQFPKSSQDLNPIEVCWRELRARLYETEPTDIEDREAFISRLRNAVAWCNKNRAELFAKLASSQKAWARDVQEQGGGRTRH